MLYKNASIPIEDRVSDLIVRMSLEEKIAQTISIDPSALSLSQEEEQAVMERGEIIKEELITRMCDGMGAFQLPGKKLSPKGMAKYRNALQRHVMENTRLQIPVLAQDECLNGHLAKGSTMFPKPIGLAGTFDTDLVKSVYNAIGVETRARGGHQAFTPVLDIGRDPRWGRIEETFGEDTYLVTSMGQAAVEGLQGGKNGVEEGHIVSSPKHFAGYAQIDGGRNFAPTVITERMLRDEILPPFEVAIKKSGMLGVMPSHAEIDGVPCHGNKRLLTDILRTEWGFEGIVVSDYNDVERLNILHHVVDNRIDAAAMGLEAGVDMDLPWGSAYKYLAQAVEKNLELEKTLNNTVKRILRLKFCLGLFENPYVDEERAEDIVRSNEHVKLAQKAAEKTIILLKNENKTLPLNIKSLNKIAVIGPNADPVEFSYYSTRPNVGVSILDGIKDYVGNSCEVVYQQGCHITSADKVLETEVEDGLSNPKLYTLDEEKQSIEQAVEITKQSDVAIVCLGGSPNTSREAVTLQPHYGDNASLDLVGNQNELLKRVLATGTLVVVVLINGKPLSCGYVYDNAPAVLEGWYLGQETGHAMANVLFGDVNPAGRLPVTIVRNSGFLPGYYSQKPTGFLKGYLFEENEPYFWFGHGLSYTEFRYSNLSLDKERMLADEKITVSIDITNIGDTDGEEVVQMYITDPTASVTRPTRELKGFERVYIKTGETRTISFTVDAEMLAFTGADNIKKAEKGTFLIHVGTNCKNTSTVKFSLV